MTTIDRISTLFIGKDALVGIVGAGDVKRVLLGASKVEQGEHLQLHLSVVVDAGVNDPRVSNIDPGASIEFDLGSLLTSCGTVGRVAHEDGRHVARAWRSRIVTEGTNGGLEKSDVFVLNDSGVVDGGSEGGNNNKEDDEDGENGSVHDCCLLL